MAWKYNVVNDRGHEEPYINAIPDDKIKDWEKEHLPFHLEQGKKLVKRYVATQAELLYESIQHEK